MKQFILFAFSFFILNCNTPRHQPNSIETITYPGPTDKTLTDFIKSIEIVRLQHNDTLIIGDNCNLLQNDSSFYLIDIFGEQSVFRFNKKGRFLNRIGEKGKGPQEYSNMLGIAIEESNNHVYIQSVPYFTLANYTKDGNFKEKRHLHTRLHQTHFIKKPAELQPAFFFLFIRIFNPHRKFHIHISHHLHL